MRLTERHLRRVIFLCATLLLLSLIAGCVASPSAPSPMAPPDLTQPTTTTTKQDWMISRIQHYSTKLGISPPTVVFGQPPTAAGNAFGWVTCPSNGRVNFSPVAVEYFAPGLVADHGAAHELCHYYQGAEGCSRSDREAWAEECAASIEDQ